MVLHGDLIEIFYSLIWFILLFFIPTSVSFRCDQTTADVRQTTGSKATDELKTSDDESMAAPKMERSLHSPVYSSEDKAKDTADCEAAERGAAILDDVSEYLFDLFDANCMDEFKRLDDLDTRATAAFEGSGRENALAARLFLIHVCVCSHDIPHLLLSSDHLDNLNRHNRSGRRRVYAGAVGTPRRVHQPV